MPRTKVKRVSLRRRNSSNKRRKINKKRMTRRMTRKQRTCRHNNCVHTTRHHNRNHNVKIGGCPPCLAVAGIGASLLPMFFSKSTPPQTAQSTPVIYHSKSTGQCFMMDANGGKVIVRCP
jgi:hypothetical protein